MKNSSQSFPPLQPPSEEAVVRYLSETPEFFEQHLELLDTLKLKHPSGAAISLIERQVQRLQERCKGLEQKLRDLLKAGSNNDRLSESLQVLAVGLLRARGAGAVLELTERVLRREFSADKVAIYLKLAQPPRGAKRIAHYFVDPADSAWEPFNAFFVRSEVICGRLPQEQLTFLFPEQSSTTGSTALLPLSCQGRVLGLLAIGSHSPERFHPGMGVEFLNHFAQLVSEGLHSKLR